MQNKYVWTDTTTDTIDWQLLGSTLTTFQGSPKRTLQKYINGWLPTNAHKCTGNNGSMKLCPCCRQTDETNTHFATCPKGNPWNAHLTCVTNTPVNTPTHTLNELLKDILLMITRGINPPLEPPDTLAIDYYPLYFEQAQIGWHHMLQGRWTTKWVTVYDAKTNSSSGLRWAKRILRNIWQGMLSRWRHRCDAEHEHSPDNITRTTNNLNVQIEQIYAKNTEMDTADRTILDKPIDETKQLPNKLKKAWINRVGAYVHAAMARTRQRLQQKNNAITQYFLPFPRAPTGARATAQRPRRRNKAHADTYDPP
jgi:hypothetical protein